MTDFDALWNFDDPGGTEAAFRKVLHEEGEQMTEPVKAQLLSQIARTLGLQRRFDEAHGLLGEAMAFAIDDPLAMSRCLIERGRVYNSSGEKEKAMAFFHRALEKAEQAPGTTGLVQPSFVAVDALHMLAIAAPAEEQMKWHITAIERAKASGDPKTRSWLGSLTNNLGWTLHDAGKFDEALRTFEEALQFRREQGEAKLVRIARWCIARCLRSLGRPADALQMQRELHQECQAAGEPDGFVEEEMGECLLELGRPEEARLHFVKAHELLSQDEWLRSGEPERLERLHRLGLVDPEA